VPSNKPKSTDSLMKYLRDEKGMAISGSTQKRKLMNIGYYHGYKGYRYIKNPGNRIPYTKFEELMAIYEFDSQMKSLFYPCVMTIETALKNYVLEEIVSETKSDSFITIYNTLLDNYKSFSTAGKTYKDSHARERADDKFKHELKRRLDLRTRIYKIQADAFGNENKIADHYLRKDKNLPIWGIFELLSLGEFGHFVSCLNQPCRAKISLRIGIQPSDDNGAMMPQRLIYATKDLRNAIAHNDVIFDTRFRTNRIDKQVSNAISNATGVKNLTFESITDYLVLVIYQMKLIGVTKTEMKRIISAYTEIVDRLRMGIPTSVFSKIVYTDNKPKVEALKKFVSK
jgi:abortive infection bacteriophage resistance protein